MHRFLVFQIAVSKTGEGEYLLKGPYAEATVNTATEVFRSDDYLRFTNLMTQLQEGMDNVYYDGAPFVRYRSQELTPATTPVEFDFQKYGIDLRGDDDAVYFIASSFSSAKFILFFEKVWLFQIKAVPLHQQIPPRFSSQDQRTRVGRFF